MAEPAGITLQTRLARGSFTLDVDLRLPARGTTVLFGPSGSGKSSLLRIAAGLEPAARGCVRIGGETWQDADSFLPPHRRALGVVFQHAALLPHLSVLDNLRYGWKRAGAATATLDAWIERLALSALLPRRPETLSGGRAPTRGAGPRAGVRAALAAVGRAAQRAGCGAPRGGAAIP